MIRRRGSTETALTTRDAERQAELTASVQQVSQLAALGSGQLRRLHRSLGRKQAEYIDRRVSLELATRYQEDVIRAETHLDVVEGEADDVRFDKNAERIRRAGFKADEVLASTAPLSEMVRELIQTATLFETANHMKSISVRRWGG